MIGAHITAVLRFGNVVPVVSEDGCVCELHALLHSAWWVHGTSAVTLVRVRLTEVTMEHVPLTRQTHVLPVVSHDNCLVGSSQSAFRFIVAAVTYIRIRRVVYCPQRALVVRL